MILGLFPNVELMLPSGNRTWRKYSIEFDDQWRPPLSLGISCCHCQPCLISGGETKTRMEQISFAWNKWVFRCFLLAAFYTRISWYFNLNWQAPFTRFQPQCAWCHWSAEAPNFSQHGWPILSCPRGQKSMVFVQLVYHEVHCTCNNDNLTILNLCYNTIL